MHTSDTPLATILLMTYNHASYVEQALEECLGQNADFPFEVIAGDDASSDGTGDILRKWAKKHPQIILSLQPQNTGGPKNFLDAMSRIRGKYVLFCEGDDFWTTPDKMQRQVHFLEENPAFSVCCHRVEMLFGKDRDTPENRRYVYKSCDSTEPRIQAGEFFADEAVANYYFQTGSFCFRWRFCDGFPHWFSEEMLFDHYLFLLHASEGKIKYFDEPMSCWRRHESGYTWLQTVDKGIFFQKELSRWLEIYSHMDNFFSGRFRWQIQERILLAFREMTKNCLAVGNLEQLRELLHNEYLRPILENAVILDAMRLVYPSEKELFPPWTTPIMSTPLPDGQTEPSLTVPPLLPTAAMPSPKTEVMLPHISVGDVLELDLEAVPPCAQSVWHSWTCHGEYACFANMRAALAAYIWHNAVTRLWVPELLPPPLREMFENLHVRCNTYPIREDFSCSTEFLRLAQSGQAVLTMCYFGSPTPTALQRALLRRPDLLWLEDRAQALWPGKPKAHATFYSPRKVLGVPDGGIWVGDGAAVCAPAGAPQQAERIREATATILDRFERRKISGSDRVTHTVRMNHAYTLPAGGASRLSLSMLQRIPMKQVTAARKNNWETLYRLLGAYALWPIAKPSFVPFGFPLLLPTSTLAMMAQSLLAAKGYASSREDWLEAPRLLILPCDHRYAEETMRTMAYEVLAVIAGNKDHAPRYDDW